VKQNIRCHQHPLSSQMTSHCKCPQKKRWIMKIPVGLHIQITSNSKLHQLNRHNLKQIQCTFSPTQAMIRPQRNHTTAAFLLFTQTLSTWSAGCYLNITSRWLTSHPQNHSPQPNSERSHNFHLSHCLRPWKAALAFSTPTSSGQVPPPLPPSIAAIY
jgi:hypothetical protein